MLGTLIHKEAMVHLLSLRFHLLMILVISLMGAGALIAGGEHRRRMEDVNNNEAERQEKLFKVAAQPGPLVRCYSYYDQPLLSRPPSLGFVAEGHGRDLPNQVRVNAFRWLGPVIRQRGNIMLPPFEAIDWVLVVGVVLSFAAIVLTFDGFAGEKEDGTLRLVLANPVARWQLVVAKAAGAWGVLQLAMLLGVLVQLLILLPGGALLLPPPTAAKLVAGFLLCGLFTGLFILLGLLISACHRSSAAALVVALLAWVLLVVVIPRSALLLAHWLQQVDSEATVAARAEQERFRVVEEYNRLHPAEANRWWSGHWSPGESLDMAFAGYQAWDQPYRSWRADQLRQVKLARRAVWLSPVTLLSAGLEQIAGTGIVHYERFLTAVDRYRQELGADLRAAYPLDPVSGFGRDKIAAQTLLSVSVDPANLPVFGDRPPALANALIDALGYALALAVLDLVLLLATVVAVLRYDVR